MKHIITLAAILLCWQAHAQAISWNADILGWTAPTQCSDGSPVAGNCDITGYKLETAASATAVVWSTVTTTPGSSLAYTVTGLTIGVHCYRLSAIAAGGSSPPSNAVCATTTQPAPSIPTLKTVDTLAYEVQKLTDSLRLAQVGTVPLDTPCKDDEANGLHVVPRKSVSVPGKTKPVVMVAKCG